MSKPRCIYCGRELKSDNCVCRPHEDLPGVDQLAICTRSPDCPAAAGDHDDDCPVEAQLKATFGF